MYSSTEDANLDGRISEDEMATALKTLNPRMTPEVIKNLFSQADLNKADVGVCCFASQSQVTVILYGYAKNQTIQVEVL